WSCRLPPERRLDQPGETLIRNVYALLRLDRETAHHGVELDQGIVEGTLVQASVSAGKHQVGNALLKVLRSVRDSVRGRLPLLAQAEVPTCVIDGFVESRLKGADGLGSSCPLRWRYLALGRLDGLRLEQRICDRTRGRDLRTGC